MSAEIKPPQSSRRYRGSLARIVMKFGGTSVANVERIRQAARHVKREVDAGNEVAVVVSAMSGKTNELVGWVNESSPLHDAREYDAVVASGEQVTAGLMAIVLSEMGIQSRSFAGWQVPIHTDDAHGAARITEIDPTELDKRMDGWLGAGRSPASRASRPSGRITTLGRGGSDTSAVAIAAAVKADRCDIYTDVDGVYTTDPRIVPKAQRLNRIAFEEMLEMASLGAKVLMIRSVEMAMAHKVRLVVRSTFDDPDAPQVAPDGTPGVPGTLVCDEDEIMEKQIVSGVTLAKAEAKITLRDVKDKPGVAAAIFGALADESIVVDMIVQNVSEDGSTTDITFTVPDSEYDKAVSAQGGRRVHDRISARSPAPRAAPRSRWWASGMRSHAGVASSMFKALADKGINIQLITTSEIKTSVLIDDEYAELAVRALHTYYGLDKQGRLSRPTPIAAPCAEGGAGPPERVIWPQRSAVRACCSGSCAKPWRSRWLRRIASTRSSTSSPTTCTRTSARSTCCATTARSSCSPRAASSAKPCT